MNLTSVRRGGALLATAALCASLICLPLAGVLIGKVASVSVVFAGEEDDSNTPFAPGASPGADNTSAPPATPDIDNTTTVPPATPDIDNTITAPGSDDGILKAVTLKNPLRVDSIAKFIDLVLDIIILIAVPIIIFFIIWSGFLYVTAQGKPDKISEATRAFTWTIVGAVILLGAKVLLAIIINTVEALKV